MAFYIFGFSKIQKGGFKAKALCSVIQFQNCQHRKKLFGFHRFRPLLPGSGAGRSNAVGFARPALIAM
jgi:hypothetical protein